MEKTNNCNTLNYETPVAKELKFTKSNIDKGTKILQKIFNTDFDFRFGRIQKVTPAQAKELLKLNTSNRDISKNHVDWLAAQQELKLWAWAANTIILGKDGKPMQSQHTLTAQEKSGSSLLYMIISGFDFDRIMPLLDTGKSRNAADVLSINNFLNPKTQSAICRKVISYNNKYYSSLGLNGRSYKGEGKKVNVSKQITTNTIILKMCTENKLFESSSILAKKFGAQNKAVTPSFWGAMYFLMSEDAGEKLASDFLSDVAFSTNLKINTPQYQLHKFLKVRLSNKFEKLPPIHYLNAFTTCWNCFILGKTMDRIPSFNGKKDSLKVIGDIKKQLI